MILIGQYNELTVTRMVDFGVYLADADHTTEILLPAKYVDGGTRVGDTLCVFVYTDSEDRPIATTRHPFATANSLAYLQAVAVTEVGAFLDWGLEKDLLVPFSEQRQKMRKGLQYLVYVYVDDATGRVVASARINRFIDNTLPEYKKFQQVEALITGHTELGYKAVVDNRHSAMIYESDVYRAMEVGQQVTAYVKKVREDGKLDLTLLAPAAERTESLARLIEERLRLCGGRMDVGDHSSPEYINSSFGCSKKDFKRRSDTC